MSDGRVVSFVLRVRPLTGAVTLTSDELFLGNGKVHHGPQWTFSALARIDGEDAAVPMHASLVAEIEDEPGTNGWLDLHDSALAGKFVVGPDWEAVIRQAAFSATSWLIDLEFVTNPEGDIQRLRVGMRRKQAADE